MVTVVTGVSEINTEDRKWIEIDVRELRCVSGCSKCRCEARNVENVGIEGVYWVEVEEKALLREPLAVGSKMMCLQSHWKGKTTNQKAEVKPMSCKEWRRCKNGISESL